MSKQNHKYITDVWSFLWGLESEVLWLELCDTEAWLWHTGFLPWHRGKGTQCAGPRQMPRAPGFAHRLFQWQGKAGIFSQQL